MKKKVASRLTKQYLNQSLVYTYQQPTPCQRAVLLLHGFPSESGKNEDMAENIAIQLGCDAYVPHYNGLGESQGEFSFRESIQESAALARYLLSHFHYSRLDLVGYSWGGFVAYHVAAELPGVRSLILMAPFSQIPSDEAVTSLLKKFKFFQTLKGRPCNKEKLAKDLDVTLKEYRYPAIPSECKIYVIQGTRDEIVTPIATKELLKKIPMAHYAEIDDNHYFKNRVVAYSAVLSSLVNSINTI